MYCNHCLPCPVNIDIVRVNRILDLAYEDISPYAIKEYKELEVKPDKCIECKVCEQRCTFDVPVVQKMKEASKLFS